MDTAHNMYIYVKLLRLVALYKEQHYLPEHVPFSMQFIIISETLILSSFADILSFQYPVCVSPFHTQQ